MRKNKKLLLASVAAMGALALGVGATSTFAWFSASSTSAALKSAAKEQVVTAAQSTIALNLPIKFTITQDDSKTVALTDAEGNTKAYNNGGIVDATIPGTQLKYGIFKISAAWVVAGDCDGSGNINIGGNDYHYASADQKLAAAGAYQGYTVGVGTNSNALLIENTNSTGANPSGTNEWTFVVVVTNAGELELRVTDEALAVTTYITEANNRLVMGTGADDDKVLGRFAVRPNNIYGAEVAASATDGCQVAGSYDKTTAIAKGQAFTDGAGTPKYYVAKASYDANATDALTNTTYFEQVYLHSNDLVTISASN